MFHTGVQHDGARLRVVEDVELGRSRRVAHHGPATHEDDPPQRREGLRMGASKQGDVRQGRERDEGDRCVGVGPGEGKIPQQGDRATRVGRCGDRCPPESAEPVRAVHVAGVDRSFQEGPVSAYPHGDISAPRGLQNGQRVAHDVGQRRVAPDAGDPA